MPRGVYKRKPKAEEIPPESIPSTPSGSDLVQVKALRGFWGTEGKIQKGDVVTLTRHLADLAISRGLADEA